MRERERSEVNTQRVLRVSREREVIYSSRKYSDCEELEETLELGS